MTAPAGHVTVAAVPKLLPVPHAVDSSDDDRERDAVADTDAAPAARERDALTEGEARLAREALAEGEPPPARDDERDGDAAREDEALRVRVELAPKDTDGDAVGERDAERLRLAVGDSPPWHCTYRMYVREPPQPVPVAAASCVLGLIVHELTNRHVEFASAPLAVAASLHVAPTAKGPLGHVPVGLP